MDELMIKLTGWVKVKAIGSVMGWVMKVNHVTD